MSEEPILKPNVLVSPTSFGECSDEPLDLLRRHFRVKDNPYKRRLSEDEVILLGADCEAIIAGVEPLSQKVLDALPGLKYISRVGSGLDNIDLEHAKRKGIVVLSTPDAPVKAVAELALALALNLLRNVSGSDRDIRGGRWTKRFGHLLSGKPIGIMGTGRIGKASAMLFKSVGCNVLGCDVNPDHPWAATSGVQYLDHDQLCRSAGIIILHVNIGKNDSPVIGEREFSLMIPDTFLINLSRGNAVDEKALATALRTGRLAGAALDVFVQEPYNGELAVLDNTVLTPHIGTYTIETRIEMELLAVKNLLDVFSGPVR